MEIKKFRVHTCNQKIEGYIVEKCNCRKYVSHKKAAELLENGDAQNIIVSHRLIEIEEPCPICGGLDQYKKSCRLCGKTGKVGRSKLYLEMGEDIYMVPFQKTPRTATVEEEHIEYAYIKGDKDAIKRIELYNGLTKATLARLGASIIDANTGDVLFDGSPEPLDDPKTATGRKYDWGRSI